MSFRLQRMPIGIDIGSRAIAAVQVSARGTGGRVRLEAATSVARSAPAPTGSDQLPTSDELKRFADVLSRQGFSGHEVVVAASESKVFSAMLELPPRSSGAPIEELARQELARASKRDAGSFEMSSWDIPQPTRSGEGTHLLAIGLAHADSEQLLELFESAGLLVKAIDCRCWALSRACAPLLAGSAQVSSILDLSESAASLVLVHSGVVAYDRPIREAGLSRLRDALCLELKIDAETADYLLERVGGAAADASVPEATVRAASKVMDEFLGMVIQELRSVMAYAIHRYPGAVGPVLLTGPGAVIGGLNERIRGELDLDAKVVTPASVVEVPTELAAVAADQSLTSALGLSMHNAAIQEARRAA